MGKKKKKERAAKKKKKERAAKKVARKKERKAKEQAYKQSPAGIEKKHKERAQKEHEKHAKDSAKCASQKRDFDIWCGASDTEMYTIPPRDAVTSSSTMSLKESASDRDSQGSRNIWVIEAHHKNLARAKKERAAKKKKE